MNDQADHAARLQQAKTLLAGFARHTGLEPVRNAPRRYLWTDAFAVCTLFTLARALDEPQWAQLALQLIDQVHQVLGSYAPQDSRTGPLSGLDAAQARLHPTIGGLRIGKKQLERAPNEPYDAQAEWDRDGQYFHYLTKWMHALERAAVHTGEVRFLRYAMELAQTAFAAFTVRPTHGTGPARMVWKMSVDLSRALVPSMGQHDALDALVTFSELRFCAQAHFAGHTLPPLDEEIGTAAQMSEAVALDTADPLGLGGLLFDAARAVQMSARGRFDWPSLTPALLAAAQHGIPAFMAQNPVQAPAAMRLAFRELGLALGLHGEPLMRTVLKDHQQAFANAALLEAQLDGLRRFVPLARTLEDFWLQPQNRAVPSWTEHEDINTVTLATALAPDGFLEV